MKTDYRVHVKNREVLAEKMAPFYFGLFGESFPTDARRWSHEQAGRMLTVAPMCDRAIVPEMIRAVRNYSYRWSDDSGYKGSRLFASQIAQMDALATLMIAPVSH